MKIVISLNELGITLNADIALAKYRIVGKYKFYSKYRLGDFTMTIIDIVIIKLVFI